MQCLANFMIRQSEAAKTNRRASVASLGAHFMVIAAAAALAAP
jgi:hypothetical protein